MEDNAALMCKLADELKLRRYSPRTIKKYSQTICSFLSSKKDARSYLLEYSGRSKSTMRGIYFALKFFYENVMNEKFGEKLPLAKKSFHVPSVLNKGEVQSMFDATANLKHKLILLFLYYTGVRLNELIHLKWQGFRAATKKNLRFTKDFIFYLFSFINMPLDFYQYLLF